MDNSPLARFSGEIRNHIYELAFDRCDPIILRFRKAKSGGGSFSLSPASQRQTHPLALLGKCKQMFRETEAIAWSSIKIAIQAEQVDAKLAMNELVAQAGEGKVKELRSLVFDTGEVRCEELNNVHQDRFEKALSAIWRGSRLVELRRLAVRFSLIPDRSNVPLKLQVMTDLETLELSVEVCNAMMRTSTGWGSNMSTILAQAIVYFKLGNLIIDIKSEELEEGLNSYHMI